MELEIRNFMCDVDYALRFLNGETKLFRGADAGGESLKVQQEILRATVNHFFEPRRASKKLVLENITDVLQNVQFVFDAYLHQAEGRWHRGVVGFFARNSQNEIAERMMNLCVSTLQIVRDIKSYMLGDYEQEAISAGVDLLENVPHFFEEDELVGIHFQKRELVNMLVGEPSITTRLVISLTGIVGVGKTTLARIAYESAVVQRHFDCHAWINVSQSYNFENLFRRLTKMMCPDQESLLEGEMDTVQELISCLNQYLMKKRYVIVFDGVCQTDFFHIMNEFLPENNNGSRIIITTRDSFITASCDIVQTRHPLSEKRAQKLFLKSASVLDCPPELDALSLEIVRRCHGLPLVIWVMGDLFSTGHRTLSSTEIASQWQAQLGNVNNEIGMSPSHIEEVSRIFYHNYDDLPSHINYDGTERMCRVQGFLHLIISSRAKRYKIFQDLNETPSRLFVKDEVRRLSIYGEGVNTLHITTENHDICSVFLFDVNRTKMRKTFVANLFERFKFLELLDFENAPLDDLPYEVGNLSLLKYLSLRNTKLKKLPKSVGLLVNLQTLDVRNTLIHELPIHIQKLGKLRHQLASTHNNKVSLDSVHGVQIKEGIGCLENLQTLMTVEAHRSSPGVIEEIEKLRQLRWLSISNFTTDMVNTICSFIEKMNHLESLNLYLSGGSEKFDLESISSRLLS